MKDKLRAGAAIAAEAEPAKPEREFWSIADTIDAYGFSRSFLYKLMDQKVVRSAKVGRRRLIHAPTLRAFVLSRVDGAGGHGKAA
jgi:hypothetical protein